MATASAEADFFGPWPKEQKGNYRPREPSSQVLFQVLAEGLDDFLERVEIESGGRGLPSFVVDELRGYLACGDLRGGFARFKCRGCGYERFLPFTCRGRGFCGSCLARRAAERSAHLINEVLPVVPIRQWVLSLPLNLRYMMLFDHDLTLAVLKEFATALLGFYQDQAKKQGITNGLVGMVSAIQRFGGALNANPHFHSNLLDGTFSRSPDGTLIFHEAPMPKQQDITVLCSVVRMRVLQLLKTRGLLGAEADLDPFADQEPLLASISGASLTSTIATGQRAGKPVLRLGRISNAQRWATRKRPLGAHIDGFDLHASTALAAGDRGALESLLRYQLRPPLSKARLTRLDDGRVKLKLRSTWSDGTSHLVLEPHELIEKLVPLVPKPGTNLIVYHGSLAPRAKDREKIVAYGRAAAPIEIEWPVEQELFDDEAPARATCKYYSHSELMKRVWGIDVLECPRCSGRLRFIQAVTEPLVIMAILSSIGLKPPPPPRSMRHEPMQLLLFPRALLKFTSPASRATQHVASRAPPLHGGAQTDVN